MNNQVYLARELHELGVIALWSGEYDDCEGHLRESLAVIKKLAYPREIAETLLSLAVLKHRQGDLAAARQMYQDSLSVSDISVNHSAAIGLALFLLEERQANEASEWLGRATSWCDDLLKNYGTLYGVLYCRALAVLATGDGIDAQVARTGPIARCNR